MPNGEKGCRFVSNNDSQEVWNDEDMKAFGEGLEKLSSLQCINLDFEW